MNLIRQSVPVFALLALGIGCQAKQSSQASQPSATEWRPLFDGKTTTGWRNYGKPTISDGWKVQDGALTRTGAGGDIITNDEFKNFELSIDWKIEPAATAVSSTAPAKTATRSTGTRWRCRCWMTPSIPTGSLR